MSLRLTSYRSPLSRPASNPTGSDRLTATLPPLPHRRRRTLEAFGPEEFPHRAMVTSTGLDLSLPLPPSINHQYATVNARRVLSARGRAYKDLVGKQILLVLAQFSHRRELLRTLRSRDLRLSIRFYFMSPLRRDVDGGLKIAQDALCEALGINDNRIYEIHLYKDRDPARPRIDVALSVMTSRL